MHKRSGVIRAMKQIKKTSVMKSKQGDLFNEIDLLREMDHPNIVRIYELFQDRKNYYLITELGLATKQ